VAFSVVTGLTVNAQQQPAQAPVIIQAPGLVNNFAFYGGEKNVVDNNRNTACLVVTGID